MRSSRSSGEAAIRSPSGRCYARALRTLGLSANPELALRLWGGLAEVSWRALGDDSTAMAAFEAARALDPHDEGPERALAALYLKVGPSASDKAVAAHQALAARAPDEPEPYRVLERLWRAQGAPEKAFWASAVLAQLGQASISSHGHARRPVPDGRPRWRVRYPSRCGSASIIRRRIGC